jgi:putative tricarboxylic transport membrane protein
MSGAAGAPARRRAPLALRARRALPYVIVLAAAIALYAFAGRIEFVGPPGRIGPDFWPKAILALAIATCAFQIVKALLLRHAGEQVDGVLGSILDEAPAEAGAGTAPPRTYPSLIVGGIALTVAYVLLIQQIGFFLDTFVYLAAFMWIGRYRRPLVVLASSLVGSLAFMYMFMKVVYVSLPLGREPFSQVTFLLMRLMGIR